MSRHSIRRLLILAVVGSAGLTLMSSFKPALAAQYRPDTAMQQHWELLGEVPSSMLLSTDIPIERGDLPGGTTGFDPAPQASFEIVAKVGNGAGSWTVRLVGSGGTLAEIPLSTTLSSWTIKTATVNWPATTSRLTKIQTVQSVGGTRTLELQKAYVKIAQSGVIKKTTPRFPLAHTQRGLTSSSWSELPDPILYKHVASEFNPSPTVTLQAAGLGRQSCEAMQVRLVDSSGSVARDLNCHSCGALDISGEPPAL